MTSLPIITDFHQATLMPRARVAARPAARGIQVAGFLGKAHTPPCVEAPRFLAREIPHGALVWLNPELLRRLA